jgi:hypothetical protein
MGLAHKLQAVGSGFYETGVFVREVRELQVPPHVAPHMTKRSRAIDGSPTRQVGEADLPTDTHTRWNRAAVG